MFITPNTTEMGRTAVELQQNARATRLMHEHRKLKNSARNYIFAHPKLVSLGDDPLVDHLISSAGFAEVDFVAIRLAAGSRFITAVFVPTRIWRDAENRASLLEIKRDARTLGTSCLLVPQRWVRAPTRSAVSRLIAHARHVRYTKAQEDEVFDHLHNEKISTIMDCAFAISGHDDPVAVILAMSASGLIDIDRTVPLNDKTWVSTKL